jgi:hypothetical protein
LVFEVVEVFCETISDANFYFVCFMVIASFNLYVYLIREYPIYTTPDPLPMNQTAAGSLGDCPAIECLLDCFAVVLSFLSDVYR